MKHLEYNECVRFHQWLEWREIPHTHIKNEEPNVQRAVMSKRIGVSKGFPDYLIFIPPELINHGTPVNVAIEMKEPSGKNKPSAEQDKWLKTLSAQGFKVSVCYGVKHARDFLIEECGLIDTSGNDLPHPKEQMWL